MPWVMIEKDSDQNVIYVTGPFADIPAAMKWLKEVRVPIYTKGSKVPANLSFVGNAGWDEDKTSWHTDWLDTP